MDYGIGWFVIHGPAHHEPESRSFRPLRRLSAALWPHQLLQWEIVVFLEFLNNAPLYEGLSNRDERDEGKEEEKD